jgi:hypothetical protein
VTRCVQIDNGAFALKSLLRQRLVDGIRPGTMVDFFAGSGRMLMEVGSRFETIYAVEQDSSRRVQLKTRLGQEPVREWADRVIVVPGDNRRFVRERLAGIAGINYLDFDAYGNPHPLIRETFAVFRPDRRAAVAVTDGARMALLRGGRLRPEAYGIPDAGPRVARTRPLSAREYELLVRGFWERLCQDRGFRVTTFISGWRGGRRVLYYGVRLEPN